MINCFVNIYVCLLLLPSLLYLHFQITNVNDWNTAAFNASIVVFSCPCVYNLTQTFRENVEMLTINSIWMRVRVCVALWVSFVIRYYFYISLSRFTDGNQCLMLCYAMPCTNCWQIDNLCKTLLYLSWKKSEHLNYLAAFFIYSILSMHEWKNSVNGKSNSHKSLQLDFKHTSKKKHSLIFDVTKSV